MSDPVRRIADAVLYEGYLLWPYRRSSPKNQQRFNFGCVMPPAWSADHPDEASEAGTEVLVEGGDDMRIDVTLRFLHVVHRQLIDADGAPVDTFDDGVTRHLTWDEATEREFATPGHFTVDAGHHLVPIAAGRMQHSWHDVTGMLTARTEPLTRRLRRLSVSVTNTTPGALWRDLADRTATTGTLRAIALRHAFCSAHLVLRVSQGAFLSPLEELSISQCTHRRMWPVLVGEAPDRSTILAAEIMLEEYPQVAAESPGDLFDGGEVDQLLTLNIMGMTDAEKAEMRASDPRARAILERTEAMTASDLMRLHGRRTVGRA